MARASKLTDEQVDQFEQFWRIYPRKVGKGRARMSFANALTKTSANDILRALSWQVQQHDWIKEGGVYVPYPATWLNDERWEDEPTKTPMLSQKTLGTMRAIFEEDDDE